MQDTQNPPQPGEQTPVEESSKALVPVPLPKRRGNPNFLPGHPKCGGRRKGAPLKRTAEAREIAERMGFHPVEFLATVAQRGVMPNPDGTETPVTTAERLDAAKAVSQYLVPKLQAMQVTGANEGPVATATLDLTTLLLDPKATEVLLQAAMLMAENTAQKELEAGSE